LFKYLFIFIIALLSITSINAQEPSYSIIGENELAGLDIYTLAQDKNNFVWLGTENGLYRFDGYEFKKYNHNDLKAKSIFGFTHDNFGELYCLNLSGQIIKIKNDSIQIIYQIPDTLLTSFYEIGFDPQNNLVIAGNRPFKVDKNNNPQLFFDSNNKSFMASFKKSKDDLFFSYQEKDDFNIINLKNGKKPIKVIFGKKATSPRYVIQNKNGYTIFKERDDFNFYDFIDEKTVKQDFKLDKTIANQFSNVSYLTSDSTIWQTTRKGGSIALNKNSEKPFHKKILFNEYYISSYLEDHEENMWLATLGKGLLFIPNTNLYSYRNLQELEKEVFTKIISNEETIWIATQSGKIIEFKDNRTNVIFNQNNTKISLLKLNKENNQLIFNGPMAPCFFNLDDKKVKSTKQFGSVKDVAFINDTLVVFATNGGIRFFNPYLNKVVVGKFIFPENIGRTSGVCFQKDEQKLWANTLKGLMILSEENAPIIFENIYSTDIINDENSVWVATKDNGIYEFKNNKIIQHLTTKTGLISDVIYKIKIVNNELFIAHEKGFQVFNLKTKEAVNYDKTDGLFINRITDFTVKNNVIWLITNKGIQFFNRKDIRKNLLAPNIILHQVLVNNNSSSISSNQIHEFNFDENNIEINFTSTSFHHQGLLKYAFKINEIDNQWQYRNFNENKVSFTALKPGKYTFTVKSINENNVESEPITYQFIIHPPFWATWWFYSIVGFVFITATILVYRYQLKKQQKKIELENELNASKLIAIQSQMNPHFIFNAINSIQDLILQGDIDNSYSYIIKFSKLVRQTLNFSDKEFIDIEEEIELLSIYLELEKLRFKDDFEYQINVNNAEDIQVPPMLVQPFVENAIKHGLLHKEGLKKLEITFNLNNTLHCTVKDNGVGRKKAQEIKQRQQKNYQSFSVDATKKRFEIMNNHYQNDFSVTYTDLMNNDKPAGTQVYISMPFKQNY
jgi:ligand-binding sensor domain-containing protein